MSLIIPKSKKIKVKGLSKTLDAYHESTMKRYQESDQIQARLQKKIKSKQDQVRKLEQSMDLISIRKKRIIVREIVTLEEELNNIKKGSGKYLQKTKDILFDYYDDSTEKDVSKQDTLRKYNRVMGMTEVEDTWVKPKAQTCDGCGQPLNCFNHDTFAICETCGAGNDLEIHSDKNEYKDIMVDQSYYAYKRINHLKECLSQWQGKENTHVPEEVYDHIIVELKKRRISNLATLSPKKMRGILRKLKLNKYYEHIPQILMKLTNKPPLKISKDVETKLCEMFMQLQKPFAECAPEGRKNFMSYSFTINKLTHLLGLYEIQQYFPLLKSRDKLREQDKIWKKICQKLDWPFYPSI